MYKTETHLHTKETSACSHLFAKEMVQLYHEAGYNTLFISDHMHHDFLEKNSDVPKIKAIERFLGGYYNAFEEGKKYGMNILPSVEYSLAFGNIHNHYLVYGIDEKFLFDNPNCESFNLEKLRKSAKDKGAMIIQAHPFRNTCFPTPLYVDGMEVLNSNPRHFIATDEERTVETIKQYGLPFSAGSDAHRPEDVAGTGIGSDNEIKSAEDFIKVIMSKNGKVLKNI